MKRARVRRCRLPSGDPPDDPASPNWTPLSADLLGADERRPTGTVGADRPHREKLTATGERAQRRQPTDRLDVVADRRPPAGVSSGPREGFARSPSRRRRRFWLDVAAGGCGRPVAGDLCGLSAPVVEGDVVGVSAALQLRATLLGLFVRNRPTTSPSDFGAPNNVAPDCSAVNPAFPALSSVASRALASRREYCQVYDRAGSPAVSFRQIGPPHPTMPTLQSHGRGRPAGLGPPVRRIHTQPTRNQQRTDAGSDPRTTGQVCGQCSPDGGSAGAKAVSDRFGLIAALAAEQNCATMPAATRTLTPIRRSAPGLADAVKTDSASSRIGSRMNHWSNGAPQE